MIVDSTIEVARYGDLVPGEIFLLKLGEGLHFAMKVISKGEPSDQPSSELLLFNSDRPPELLSSQGMFSSGAGRRPIVAKMKKTTFTVRPEMADILFDVNDARARMPGSVFLIEGEIFLCAEVRNVGFSYVNMKTGEGIGEIERRNAVVVPCWQLVETVGGQEATLLEYRVPQQP